MRRPASALSPEREPIDDAYCKELIAHLRLRGRAG
jgi:hypothetical protein